MLTLSFLEDVAMTDSRKSSHISGRNPRYFV